MKLSLKAVGGYLAPVALSLTTGFGLTAASTATAGCAEMKPITKTVLDGGDAICEALIDNGLAGEKVTLVCEYVDKADGLSHVFLMRVPREHVEKMGLKAARPAPAQSASK